MFSAVLRLPRTIQNQLISLGFAKSFLIAAWPFVAIITAHFIWGVNFVVAKVTLQEIPPMSLAFLRYALAVVLLTPFIIMERKKMVIEKEDLPKLILIGILTVTLNIAFFYMGLSKTSATSASALSMVIPIFSVLGGWWILKEKIYVANIVGIVFGLAGAVLVLGLPLLILGLQTTSDALLGNFLQILSAVCWVSGAILSREMLKKYSTLTITAVLFLVGVITFLIPAINEYLQNPNWINQLTYVGLSGLFFIALASSVSAFFLFEWGLGKLGVIKADLFQYLEPLVATSLAVLFLSEQLRFTFIIGALLIGLGAYCSTLGKESHKHHKAHRH